MGRYEEDIEGFATFIPAEPIGMSSLCVNVEFLDLVEQYGEEKSWEILGKLKDLLG